MLIYVLKNEKWKLEILLWRWITCPQWDVRLYLKASTSKDGRIDSLEIYKFIELLSQFETKETT